MGKKKDLSPRKKGQICVLLEHSDLKQKEIAKKLNVSPQVVSATKQKLKFAKTIDTSRIGSCGRKRITTPKLDRKIKVKALNDRRASCTKLSMELAKQGIVLNRKTINNRLLEQGIRACRPRKKPRLTQKMKDARYQWAMEHQNWTSEDWAKVSYFLVILV